MYLIADCLDPGFGSENGDGYVRIRPQAKVNKYVMRHRWMWEQLMGHIPIGYEINHKCKNRRCCNVDHLECIEGRAHAILTNKGRYASVIELGCRMLNAGCTKDEVQEATGRTRASINKWIREGTINLYK